MTETQKGIFKEISGRKFNDKNNFGSWNTNPGESLTAWFFTFKVENDILYTCMSNRMCGERYTAFDIEGNKLSPAESIFDDLEVDEIITEIKDNLRIRKYTASEPVATVGAEM